MNPSAPNHSHPEQDDYDRAMQQGKQVLDNLHDRIAALQDNPMSQQQQPECEKNQSQPMSNSKAEQLDGLRGMSKKTSKAFIGCNCLKSKCSKNYCECFTQGRKCNELCKCMGCQNNTESENRYRAAMELEEGERACYCKKSNCLKKYCECYNNNLKCTSNCKCEECRNCQDDPRQEPEQEEMRDEGRRERSEQELEEINSKIEEIARITQSENQEYILAFLEYLLS